MIISDVDQRRLLVNNFEDVKRIQCRHSKELVLVEYEELQENLYLITITNLQCGDYHRNVNIKNVLKGLAKNDREYILQLVSLCEKREVIKQ